MYRKISIEANEYNKIDRWAKIKSKSEEIARVAQIALNLDSSTEEARLVEEIVLNLLREIRILREEQNREPMSRSNSAPASSTSTSGSITTTITTTSFRNSGGSDSSDHADSNDDNTRYDKDNPALATSSSAPPLSHLSRTTHTRPRSTPHSPSMKLMAQRSSSAPNSPPTILSDHYNPQFVQPYQTSFMQFSNPYVQQDPTLQLSSSQPLPLQQIHPPQFSLSSALSSFHVQQPTTISTIPPPLQPPLPPPLPPSSQNAELVPISPHPPGLPQPHKQKKRKSEKKPP